MYLLDTSENSHFRPNLSEDLQQCIDPVFAKTNQNARFLLSENERFGLVFVKTGSINSGTVFMRVANTNLHFCGIARCHS